MVLPLAKAPRGYLRLTYTGPVDDIATQSWDLTQFPEYIRADPSFKTSLLIFVKGGAGLTEVEDAVSFFPPTGTPTALVLDYTAAATLDEIQLDVWCLHSIVGGVVDGPKVYFFGGGGGGDTGSGQYTPNVVAGDNISSAQPSGTAKYSRIENIVTVSGAVIIQAIAPNVDSFIELSLPIPSNMVNAEDVNGTASGNIRNTGLVVRATFSPQARIQFRPLDASMDYWTYIYQYLVVP